MARFWTNEPPSGPQRGENLVKQAKMISMTPAAPSSHSLRIATPQRERAARQPATGVVAQVREAFRPKNRLATTLGCLLGGFVPLASYVVSHHELDATAGLWQLPALLVLGGLAYSARTVYAWGCLAFGAPIKALGFVVLVEGVMVASRTPWLSAAALAYLICINGIATGCTLAVGGRR